jgi:hypothetical protein
MLQKVEFAGAGNRLGAVLDVEFAENGAIVALDGAEGE